MIHGITLSVEVFSDSMHCFITDVYASCFVCRQRMLCWGCACAFVGRLCEKIQSLGSSTYYMRCCRPNKQFWAEIVIIFLPISLNRCFRCSKEPSQWDGSFEYLQHMFWLRFPASWYVQPAKSQISMRILAVWSKPLLIAWIIYDC